MIDLSTGKETTSQTLRLPEPGYPYGRQYLRLLAENLPAAGYKVFELRAGAGQNSLRPD